MIYLFLFLFHTHSDEIPTVPVIEDYLSEEFSERIETAPITKIKPRKIQLTSPRFEHLFNRVTGLQVRTEGSPSTSIRGSQQAGRVLFLLDHIPLNFIDGFGGSPLFVPTEILDRVHIMEGPSSASYGAPAMAGAIHFIPEISKNSRVRLGLSDNDESFLPNKNSQLSTMNISIVSPLYHSESDKIQLSGFYEKDRGDFPYEDTNGYKNYRQNNSSHNRRFTFYGQHNRERWRWSEILLFSHLNKITPGSLVFPLVTQQKSDAALAGLSSKYLITDRAVWTSRLSYSFLNSTYFDANKTISDAEQFWISQGLIFNLFNRIISKTYLDWNYNTYQATFANNEKYTFASAELNQSLTIPLGTNLFFEPQYKYLFRFEKSLVNFILKQHLGPHNIWLMYTQGYRPPSLTDLYSQYLNFFGNPNLLPETSEQIEIGGQLNYKYLNFKTSLFLTNYDNMIQAQTLSGGQSTKINIGEARSYGLNYALEIPYHPFFFEYSHSFLNAKNRSTEQTLNFSPAQQIFVRFAYEYKRMQFSIQQSWWSEFYDTDFVSGRQVELTEWSSTDLIFDTGIFKKTNLSLGVYNLFNNRRELTFSYPEPQRRYALALEYNF